MNWLFWRKKANENSTIELLQQQVNDLQEHALKITDQLTKLSRHQVKTSKNMEEKIDEFKTVISAQTEREKLLLENDHYKNKQMILVDTIIGMLDEIDHVSAGVKEKDKEWYDMLDHWTQNLIADLEKVGVYQLDVWGKGFNPQFSESIQTISKAELDITPMVDYQVVEVLKRGFVDEHGKLLRKAQVITVEEDLHE